MPAKGKISGDLSYPSDAIPTDLDVCAETLDGKSNHCGAEKSGSTYTLDVPAGAYRVYAYLKSDPKNRAYYSQFVRCGYELNCPSHEPIMVTVRQNETVARINPGDWYANVRSDSDSSAAREEAEDPFYDPEPEHDPETELSTSGSAPARLEATRARPIGSVPGLFSTDDYPASAVRNDEEGTTGVRINIGPDGRVWSCDVIASSGSASLDNATCSILRRRARFVPARDEEGNAVPDSYVQRIRWTLGE